MEADQPNTSYRYRHQSYPTTPKIAPRRVVLQVGESTPGEFAALHWDLGVKKILLVHGTFVGDDPFGIVDILQCVGGSVPFLGAHAEQMAGSVRERTRQVVNNIAEDVGNYSPAFLTQFQQLVGAGITVELLEPKWSSQNDHLARADLAVRLLHWLINRVRNENERVLLWGHSHAGNGFALLSNLLANERTFVERFFESAGDQTKEHWRVVRSALADAPSPHPLAKQLLVAAFGTPVRYGWDMTGLRSLVHVLFNRETTSGLQTHPLFPPLSLNDFLTARYGDWVQTFAVAGTDLSAPTSVTANEKMHQLLETSLIEESPLESGLPLDVRYIYPARLRDLCIRWKTGTRCHTDGVNLLLDYVPSGMLKFGMPLEQCVLGHGVATTIPWLPAHLKLVTETLLGD